MMKPPKSLLAAFSFFFFLFPLRAQPVVSPHSTAATGYAEKAAADAFLICRMAALYHAEPRPVDVGFSRDLFALMLAAVDPDKIYLDAGDLRLLTPFREKLDQEVLGRRTEFMQALAGLLAVRLHETDSLAGVLAATPQDLFQPATLTLDLDSTYAPDAPARREKFRLVFRRTLLESLADELDDADSAAVAHPGSLEPTIRLRTAHSFQREIRQKGSGLPALLDYTGRAWCESVAGCFDPHTEFFSPERKQEFQGELGDKQMIFGFSLGNGKPGIVITRLKPGSPAYKSGQMNEGDKVLAIQWVGEPEEDVEDGSPEEVHALIAGGGNKSLTLTLKKSDGSTRKVTLQKAEAADNDDEGKVKSCVLKGSRKIGFISLPAFYTRWEEGQGGNQGCADDVAREILKLRRENIDGLILDLRYNGGGSVQEAVSLAGIFIDAGPVAMQRGQSGKIFTLKDVNRGSVYDGPLLVLVNGFSASASEVLAGTLQDYHRAFILGSPTFGKATAQVVLPLDTLVAKAAASPDEFLKLTVSRLYRVTGASAQQTGVQPDFSVPDFTSLSTEREHTLLYSLAPGEMAANKYFHPYPALPLAALRQFARAFSDSNVFLRRSLADVDSLRVIDRPRDEELTLPAVLEEHARSDAWVAHSVDFRRSAAFPFTIEWSSYEKQRMISDEDLRNSNRQLKGALSGDPELLLAYEVVSRM